MTWSDTIYLKFPSSMEFDADAVDGVCDVIGLIYHDDGTEADGFHVNVRLADGAALPAGWDAYVTNPSNPKRVFV